MLSEYCCLLLFAIVLEYSLNPAVFVHAQDDNPPGFVSIDCGLPEGSDYKVRSTGIYYHSDANLIDSGESKTLSPSPEKYLSTVRSFPHGKKNCYTFRPSLGKGSKYLIRATFKYGNYDSLNQLPTFDLNIGPDTWSKIEFQENSDVVRQEIIHILSSDYIHVCLIKTGTTTPFISALELRPLNSTDPSYTVDSVSLQTFLREDCCSGGNVIRYQDDIYDRHWSPQDMGGTGNITALLDINNMNIFRVPKPVLMTACRPYRISDPLELNLKMNSSSDEFYIFLHFTEVENFEASQSRQFYIYLNDILWHTQTYLPYLSVISVKSSDPETGSTSYTIKIKKTASSTLPPILNAYEIYTTKKFSNSGTNDTDVSAILDIKSTYGVIRDWQGDPCEPEVFLWDGLQCSYHSADHSARIISLNLSTSGLKGEIDDSIANLTQLKTLDLSHNDLNGQVPEFLSQLPLSVLNLKGNKFTGPIPAQLLENQMKGILSLSYDGSGDKKKNNKSTPAVVGAVLGSVVFLAALYFGIRKWRRGRILSYTVLERKNRRFKYSEVLKITGNLETVLGEGGSGMVYRGSIDNNIEVAVKILSKSSPQSQKEFETEASLLMSISHKNITSFLGYCNESPNMGIIYEYMAEGSLEKHLEVISYATSSWKSRLQISLDVAEGLEYLHHGCKPAIIHRDVKPNNILLNDQFQAKLADFGLSKAYPAEGGTHVLTVRVAGTPGYIDPDYGNSRKPTEKSDVFSFGVVLLEMITGRPPFIKPSNIPIAEWVQQNGDLIQVVDQRLKKSDIKEQSALKAVELALRCSSRTSSDRPTMNEVVLELKVCLDLQTKMQSPTM